MADYRCTALRARSRKCGRTGAHPKVTQKMVGRAPVGGFTTQPMFLCEKHWDEYQEVGAISGHTIKRSFPEGR